VRAILFRCGGRSAIARFRLWARCRISRHAAAGARREPRRASPRNDRMGEPFFRSCGRLMSGNMISELSCEFIYPLGSWRRD